MFQYVYIIPNFSRFVKYLNLKIFSFLQWNLCLGVLAFLFF
jgi:hypothetical protein